MRGSNVIMRCSREVVIVFAMMALTGLARAEPEEDRQNERYVIRPGFEALLSDIVGSGQRLPGGCSFTDGRIERSYVLATYTCDSGTVVLRLLHPEVAPAAAVRTHRFGIVVKSGVPLPELLDTLAERIRAREASFVWTDLGVQGSRTIRWTMALGTGTVLALLAYWVLRPLTIRRRAAS